MGMKPTVPDDGALQQQIGTAYDTVKLVADALPAIYAVLDAVDTITGSYVLKTTTVNNKPLSSNINLNATDVGARASTWVPAWAEITNKPSTLSGYGITDAQPASSLLDAFNTNIASATAGIFKKTAANTWSFVSLVATDIPNLDTAKITSGTLPVARGGTGRTDNKTAALITPVTITIGSTGKSFDGSAVVSWSLAEIGAQSVNANLTSFSALSGAADRLPYFTGLNTVTLATFTAFGRSVVAATDATTVNNLLGVQTKADTDLVAELFNLATYDLDFVRGIYKEYRGRYLYQLPLLEAVVCNRNGTATANGPNAVNTFDANEPRIAYDPVTGRRLGLLGEETRTNLCLWSEDFTNAAWTKNAVTVSSNATAAPDNLITADKIVEDTTTGAHEISQAIVMSVGVVSALSVYVKAGERNRVRLAGRLSANWSVLPSGIFDLVSGAVVSSTGAQSAEITKVQNGWYRCTIYGNPSTTNVGLLVGLVESGTTSSYTGNGASGLFVWGSQVEVGIAPTSYIPNTNIALNRLADVISEPLSITNANAGAIFIDFDLTSYDTSSASATVIVKLCDSANTNNRGFGLTLSGNQFALRLRDSVISNSVSITVSNSLLPKKALISFDLVAGQILIAVDGVTSSGSITAGIDLSLFVSNLFIDGGTAMIGSTIQHNKTVKRCTYFPRSFTAAEAAAITK